MDDYIKRSNAVNAIDEALKRVFVTPIGTDIMRNVPAADVAPVVHGRWIWDDEGYHCSECFYHAYGETGEVLSGNWHFCPNCGATMDKEDHNG